MTTLGKPNKLTPELTEKIVARVLRGIEPDTAAQAEGIDRATYYRWIKAGREDETGESPCAVFATTVARACAEAESSLVETWLGGDEQGVGFGPAKAAAEFLRLTKRRYGEKVRIQVADELQELLSIVEGVCSPTDFARVLEAIAARDRGEAPGDAAVEAAERVH
jgi:hypothetical protein